MQLPCLLALVGRACGRLGHVTDRRLVRAKYAARPGHRCCSLHMPTVRGPKWSTTTLPHAGVQVQSILFSPAADIGRASRDDGIRRGGVNASRPVHTTIVTSGTAGDTQAPAAAISAPLANGMASRSLQPMTPLAMAALRWRWRSTPKILASPRLAVAIIANDDRGAVSLTHMLDVDCKLVAAARDGSVNRKWNLRRLAAGSEVRRAMANRPSRQLGRSRFDRRRLDGKPDAKPARRLVDGQLHDGSEACRIVLHANRSPALARP